MPKTRIQKQKPKIWNICHKIKKIQSHGKANCVTIPNSWLNAFGWDIKTKVLLSVFPDEKKIIITDISERSDLEIEEISGIISVSD